MRYCLVLAACCAALFGFVPAAGAEDVDLATLSDLAGQAAGDEAALDRLRAVTTVDGVPVDMADLLDAAGPALPAVLATLADLAAAGAGSPPHRDPGELAGEILAGDEYRTGSVAGGRSFLDDVVEFLERILPEPLTGSWGLLLAILILGGLGYVGFIRRGPVEERRRGASVEFERAGPGPEKWAAAADAAAAQGDFSMALRLRYSAGVATLAADGVFPYSETVSSDAVRRLAPVEVIPVLDRFDAVAYGGHTATDADDAAARSGWERIVGAPVPDE